MEPFVLGAPRFPAISADAEPNASRGDDDLGTRRVSTHLVDITIDFNGWMPGDAAVR
jgi:hypothetical protein